jgi:trigger factor
MRKTKYVGISLVLAMGMSLLTGCGSKGDTGFKTSADMIEKYGSYCTLGDYTGLEYDGYQTEITDDMVQSQIDSFISDYTTTDYITEGTAKLGDTVNIDYVGSIDGEEFDGGSTNGAGTDLELGSGTYIDGFEDQIVGHEVGDSFDVEVTFPEDYGVDTLNGQDAVFAVTLNSIASTTTPDYDDAFIASNTDYSTVAEYEESVRTGLVDDYAEYDNTQNKSSILSLVMDNTDIEEYPEQELEEKIEDVVSQVEEIADGYGYDLATYVTAVYGMSSEDDFREYVSDAVCDELKEKIVVCAIAQAEGIEVSDDEIQEAKQQLIANYGYSSVSEFEEDYPSATSDDYMLYALEEKVLDFLLENNTLVISSDDETSTESDAEEATDTDADEATVSDAVIEDADED